MGAPGWREVMKCPWSWHELPCALQREHPSPHHIIGEQPQFDAILDKAEAALADANALLVPIEWWYCVWCETKYPYTDDVEVLKTHSAKCEKHPAIAQRDAAAAAERERLVKRGSSDESTAQFVAHGYLEALDWLLEAPSDD